jgi:superfamily II DNA/RNA helicase
MDQKARMETLDAFKSDKLQLLIASDVAARGLDIPAVSHVFNFDVPTPAEDYVHRIGRTGRAGRSGVAITLAAPAEGKYIDAITKLIGKDIPEAKLPGDAVAAAAAPRANEAPAERPARGRRGATRGGRTDSNGDARPPRREPRPQREDAPEWSDRKVEGIDADSPFGADGPIPAFLLRPSRVG